MYRTIRLMIALAVLYAVSGCATTSDVKILDARVTELSDRADAISRDIGNVNDNLNRLMTQLGQIEQLTGGDNIPAGMNAMKGDIAYLTQEIAKLAARVEAIEAEGAHTEPYSEQPASAPAAQGATSQLKIKVLGPAGDIKPARKVAEMLSGKGYTVTAVGEAEGKISTDVIYYAEGYRQYADDISTQLQGVQVKPLTWKSTFHLIVVKSAK